MSTARTILSIAACSLALGAALSAGEKSWLLKAERVYTAAGQPIENGFVKVTDGRIAVVSAASLDSSNDRLEVGAITPGLIDLSVHIDLGFDSVEQSTETPIAQPIERSIDLYDARWDRELLSGVTTVLLSPPDRAVLGGLSAVLKTGGPARIESRLLKSSAALRGAIGDEPSDGNRASVPTDFYARRPTTRMGVEWVLRDAFYKALAAKRFPERANADTQVLTRVIAGELPLMIQAWTTQDIRTTVFLKEEFKLPRVIVDAAAEAWKDPQLLVRSGCDVVLPPFAFGGRTGPEGAFFSWNTAQLLHERGLRIALSGHGAEDTGERLALQPALAMRGGLSFEAALAAVTINPARMVGVDDRVGSIEAGKDADLVLWSGTPFEPTSRVIGVMLSGELVLDPRAAK